MSETESAVLKTRIYIDGYNLFYGLLKGTPYRWLNPVNLIEQILAGILIPNSGAPTSSVLDGLAAKYFTAAIIDKFARNSDSVATQSIYWKALSAHLGPQLAIIQGRYEARRARAHRYEPGLPPSQSELIEVWKLEEKQTDVQLASHVRIPHHAGHRFHVMPVSDSRPCRSPIPEEAGRG